MITAHLIRNEKDREANTVSNEKGRVTTKIARNKRGVAYQDNSVYRAGKDKALSIANSKQRKVKSVDLIFEISDKDCNEREGKSFTH